MLWYQVAIRGKTKGNTMIGLSLSFCVTDVLKGKVTLKDIEYIVAGTCAGNSDAYQDVLAGYAEKHWIANPEEGVRVALELYRSGKVHQPRLANANRFPVTANKVYWVQTADQIVWSDASEQDA